MSALEIHARDVVVESNNGDTCLMMCIGARRWTGEVVIAVVVVAREYRMAIRLSSS